MSTAIKSPTAFDRKLIGELSASQIEQMTCAELAHVIRAVHPALLTRGMLYRLENRDREELMRLAYLCRRCCRQQRY
jgi:hypothetical protein